MKNDILTAFLHDAYSWQSIPSKNPWMLSFAQEDPYRRMNYYFTTGTVTIQDASGNIKTWRMIRSLDQFEEIL